MGLETGECRRCRSLSLTPPASLRSHGSRPRPTRHSVALRYKYIYNLGLKMYKYLPFSFGTGYHIFVLAKKNKKTKNRGCSYSIYQQGLIGPCVLISQTLFLAWGPQFHVSSTPLSLQISIQWTCCLGCCPVTERLCLGSVWCRREALVGSSSSVLHRHSLFHRLSSSLTALSSLQNSP